jgi:hypothetical protein
MAEGRDSQDRSHFDYVVIAVPLGRARNIAVGPSRRFNFVWCAEELEAQANHSQYFGEDSWLTLRKASGRATIPKEGRSSFALREDGARAEELRGMFALPAHCSVSDEEPASLALASRIAFQLPGAQGFFAGSGAVTLLGSRN